jgi:hypothetical protein
MSDKNFFEGLTGHVVINVVLQNKFYFVIEFTELTQIYAY